MPPTTQEVMSAQSADHSSPEDEESQGEGSPEQNGQVDLGPLLNLVQGMEDQAEADAGQQMPRLSPEVAKDLQTRRESLEKPRRTPEAEVSAVEVDRKQDAASGGQAASSSSGARKEPEDAAPLRVRKAETFTTPKGPEDSGEEPVAKFSRAEFYALSEGTPERVRRPAASKSAEERMAERQREQLSLF